MSIDEVRMALIEQITVAFRDVKRGNGVSLHEAEVIDQCGSDKKRAAARRMDMEERWQDIPDQEIEDHYSILSFLDAEGLHYYLPAYMIWALKYFQTSASMSSDSIIYQFDVKANQHLHDWQMARLKNLTDDQKTAICRFLWFMVEHGNGYADDDAAARALESHWGQFCDP